MSVNSTILHSNEPYYHLYENMADDRIYLRVITREGIEIIMPVEYIKVVDGKINIEINIDIGITLPEEVLEYIKKHKP